MSTCDSGIPRGGLSAILPPNATNARVTEQTCNGSRLVRRPVIDDDQVPIVKGLFEDGLNGLPNVLRGIKCRHDDADSG